MKIINLLVLTVFSSILLNQTVNAQNLLEVNNDSLPLDPGIKTGELPNGFKYYIKSMEEPQEKIYMHLIVKAGSRHEKVSELDMAHAIEHLAFNPSNKFSNNFLNNLDLRTKLGMEQQDLFAQTSWEFTDYNFYPAANHFSEALNAGLQFFKAIGSEIKFTDKEVKEEQGVLRQEVPYRTDNLMDWYIKSELETKLFPCGYDVTNFFKINEQMTAVGLEEFYKKWYRPDRMALIILGNIDNLDKLQKQIAATFSGLENPSVPIILKDCQQKYFERPPQFIRLNRTLTKFSPVIDSRVEFYLFYRDTITREKNHTWDGIKREFLWSIIPKIIEERFQDGISPYEDFRKIIARYSYDQHPSALSLFLTSTNHNEKEVLLEAIAVVQDLKETGISAIEWERLKKQKLMVANTMNFKSPGYWIEVMTKNFVFNKAIPDNREEDLVKWFQNLSNGEFNQILSEMLRIMPDDIGIIAPSEHYINNLNEHEVRKWIKEADSTKLRKKENKVVPEQLLSDEEKISLTQVAYEEDVAREGWREVKLSNGITIILKSFQPSLGKDHDKIIIHGFSPNGAFCVPEKDYYSAINAPNIVKFSGVGDFNRYQLDQFLNNTSVRQGLFPYISNFETGIKGKARIDEIEILLQLFYLYFSNSRKDVKAYDAWKKKEVIKYLDPTVHRIGADFADGIDFFLKDKTQVPRGTRRIKGLKQTEFQRSHELYDLLFKNPKDFTFTITGDFSIEEIMPLIQKYLGNIPDSGKPLECDLQQMNMEVTKNGPSFTKIPLPDHYVMESTEYNLQYIAKQEGVFDWKEYIHAKALGYYLTRKIDELRYEKGAALYQMFAGTVYYDESSNYLFYISLDGIPEEINWLRSECKEMIKDMKKQPLDKAIFNEIKQNALNILYGPAYFNRNDQVSERLYRNLRFGVPILQESEALKIVESLKPADIQMIANKHLKSSNMFEFVMGKQIVE